LVARLNKDGTVKSVVPFITGFLQNNEYWGRPVDVQVTKDGSLLISDDYAGAGRSRPHGTGTPTFLPWWT
jgi:glucose/arabinose dehydrogenase